MTAADDNSPAEVALAYLAEIARTRPHLLLATGDEDHVDHDHLQVTFAPGPHDGIDAAVRLVHLLARLDHGPGRETEALAEVRRRLGERAAAALDA